MVDVAKPGRDDLQSSYRLLEQWWARAKESQMGHYGAANYYNGLNLRLGIPAIALSTSVGTAAFATLSENNVANIWQVLAGLLSVFAAILAALQTFLRLPEKAEAHQNAAGEYSALKRRIERVYTYADEVGNKEVIARIEVELSELAQQNPTIPRRARRRAARFIEQTDPIPLDQIIHGP